MVSEKSLWRMFGAVVALGLVLSGCSSSLSSDEQQQNNTELARVVIPLPTPKSRAVGLAEAQNYTNYFEVLFRRDDSGTYIYYSASATIDEGSIEVNIPVGTYDILLLAGNKDEYYSLVLASSYVLGRSIVLEEVNKIDMVLATVVVDIISPDTVTIGGTFNPRVEINVKNPLLSFYYAGLYYEGEVSISSPSLLYSNSSENNIWTFTSSEPYIAPLVPTQGKLFVEQGGNTYPSFGGGRGLNWTIANPSHPVLGDHYKKQINFIEGQAIPKVEINVSWPDSE
jgi:hypothetical protein